MGKTLIIGSSGQIGSDLVGELSALKGKDNVIASDIREPKNFDGTFVTLDATNKKDLERIIDEHDVSEVYLLAALLSATAEMNPQFAWDLNMGSLSHVLDLAREGKLKKIFFPSSIAVFGPTTPKDNTPQRTILEPSTVYGITKLAGERWAEYYFKRYGTDIRGIRYPGLISYKALPGGGTTDYAVQIFYDALQNKTHECFLNKDTELPMLYMSDAVRGTINLMEAPADQIKIRSAYNLAGFSFTPEQIAASIQKHIPNFKIAYQPDYRQAIADSWPNSIDDSEARKDWGWKPKYDLDAMVEDMLTNLEKKLA
ncbi:NAD-dependent epimerase/dehydratase family protein [Luteibaculum oceani]|uniref:NAD-dependent epimerase/dehydratase family protein n=1 Tax=Luteibaculum oceani TaxID=1294296 RepID=A0A5C6VLS9_9FLAO|nr:NAD-dependent epimerase/dehydratase family protein [Luteibaculum oceani]TXC85466.1 NAD-dependent epimerase/dehydratase family protein [Luteibaculum oceani]